MEQKEEVFMQFNQIGDYFNLDPAMLLFPERQSVFFKILTKLIIPNLD